MIQLAPAWTKRKPKTMPSGIYPMATGAVRLNRDRGAECASDKCCCVDIKKAKAEKHTARPGFPGAGKHHDTAACARRASQGLTTDLLHADHTIAGAFLGLVKAVVCSHGRLLESLVVMKGRHANTDGVAYGLSIVVVQDAGLGLCADVLGDRHGGFLVDVHQNRHELFATIATGEIGRPQGAPQDAGKVAQ